MFVSQKTDPVYMGLFNIWEVGRVPKDVWNKAA